MDEELDGTQERLFSRAELTISNDESPEAETNIGENPVWTEKKARFISLYLRFFVYITHHGTYIDGFAGPQAECETESWSARLVLESRPRWIRHLHLCDANRSQVKRLNELKAAQPLLDDDGKAIKREIRIYQGDFNQKVDEILATGEIDDTEATFCLLDQRTFECDWATVEKLARYKKTGNKIELFYFLAIGWHERALSATTKDTERLAQWWGRNDWTALKDMKREELRATFVDRLRTEFGYTSVKAYPIYNKESGGAIMYYMIHATDHPEGPKQMARAYRNTVRSGEPWEDRQMDLFTEPKEPESELGSPVNELTA